MKRTVTLIGSGVVVAGLAAAIGLTASAVHSPAKAATEAATGKAKLVSAGALAFGPAGILFVADSQGAAVAAIDTKDTKAPASAVKINVEGLDTKIAALVGVTPDQIVINDMKVNPVSKNVYVSASRGRGPDAMPVIVRIDGSDKISAVSLDNATIVSLVDAPAAQPGQRNDPRMQTITDMAYVNGNLMVAGLSNEEWSSALRSIPYPFKAAQQGATLQIWHSSHGRYETQSPVRTFVPYTIGGQQYILAAYTCTPLVKIPVSQLTPGAQVKGVEIADLGAGNQPLDMIPYQKNGHNYILVANSSFGVVKLKADNIETYPAIAEPQRTDVAGVPYDKITDITNVLHMAQIDGSSALMMIGKPGAGPAYAPGPAAGPISLKTIELPS